MNFVAHLAGCWQVAVPLHAISFSLCLWCCKLETSKKPKSFSSSGNSWTFFGTLSLLSAIFVAIFLFQVSTFLCCFPSLHVLHSDWLWISLWEVNLSNYIFEEFVSVWWPASQTLVKLVKGLLLASSKICQRVEDWAKKVLCDPVIRKIRILRYWATEERRRLLVSLLCWGSRPREKGDRRLHRAERNCT